MTYRASLFPRLAVAAIVLLAAAVASARPTPFAAVERTIDKACKAFTAYDRDGDGAHEIVSLARVAEGGRHPYEARGKDKGLVVVLCENRLWSEPAKGSDTPDLRPSIRTFVQDLGREGYQAVALVSSLYAGPKHEDGLIVLALRDFLQSVRRDVPDLKGVMLVGNYPNAFMVRQYYWQRGDSLTLHAGTAAQHAWNAVAHVRSIAEPVAAPADIVLADLDGHWDQLYRPGPERISGLYAAFPDDPKHEVTDQFEYTAIRYQDFFLVPDGTWEETPAPGGKRRFTFPGEPNAECTDADKQQTNILARPDIGVGRIDAFHAGIVPDPAITGVHGEGLRDAQGRPQAVEFADGKSVPRTTDIWVPSEKMERKLLVEYFARNHAYRTGTSKTLAGPANASTEWGSSVPEMKEKVAAWKSCDTTGLDLTGSVNITDFVAWMKRPALARAIKAHSNGMCSEFGGPADLKQYEASLGSGIWYWTREGNRLVPSMRGMGGRVEFGLLRTLYENRDLSATPCLYFHTGCESITPANYDTSNYMSPKNGLWQLAESFLMLGNGLTYVGRGKVFYDEPRDFWQTLGSGGTWFDAYRKYFDVEGADAELAKDGIGRKRAYFWSTLGDFTIRLPRTAEMKVVKG